MIITGNLRCRLQTCQLDVLSSCLVLLVTSQVTSHDVVKDESSLSYECNDARDDYSKLLKQKNATDGVLPHWFKADDNENEKFDDDNYGDGSDFMVHEEYEADQYTSIGKKGQQRMEQMAEIQKIVTSAGWLDQCPDGPSSVDFSEIEAEELPPSQWDAAVQEKCQQVLAEINKSLPAQSKN